MKAEKDYYEPVGKWAKRSLGCFHYGIDKGLRHGRIDVIGLRDAGGRLSGRAEVVAIEVKRGNAPFKYIGRPSPRVFDLRRQVLPRRCAADRLQ